MYFLIKIGIRYHLGGFYIDGGAIYNRFDRSNISISFRRELKRSAFELFFKK